MPLTSVEEVIKLISPFSFPSRFWDLQLAGWYSRRTGVKKQESRFTHIKASWHRKAGNPCVPELHTPKHRMFKEKTWFWSSICRRKEMIHKCSIKIDDARSCGLCIWDQSQLTSIPGSVCLLFNELSLISITIHMFLVHSLFLYEFDNHNACPQDEDQWVKDFLCSSE